MNLGEAEVSRAPGLLGAQPEAECTSRGSRVRSEADFAESIQHLGKAQVVGAC
jgi:hypothetical protein